ncbi:hypothetical protein HK096_008922 [Nowakowskiella sp. JEL0078]|nr:hypothetical protein HK096_008922 [Nowakowskiella sp. JEL0078]
MNFLLFVIFLILTFYATNSVEELPKLTVLSTGQPVDNKLPISTVNVPMVVLPADKPASPAPAYSPKPQTTKRDSYEPRTPTWVKESRNLETNSYRSRQNNRNSWDRSYTQDHDRYSVEAPSQMYDPPVASQTNQATSSTTAAAGIGNYIMGMWNNATTSTPKPEEKNLANSGTERSWTDLNKRKNEQKYDKQRQQLNYSYDSDEEYRYRERDRLPKRERRNERDHFDQREKYQPNLASRSTSRKRDDSSERDRYQHQDRAMSETRSKNRSRRR